MPLSAMLIPIPISSTGTIKENTVSLQEQDQNLITPSATPSASPSDLIEEVSERRTFAIISHPDAGKTTLTEKLLLYGGAVQLAGSVTARRSQRHAASDWMAMEQQRGISITSTVLAFPYKGHHLNLLDTPGHQDFSEDTYRTLTAVDSAVMVLDGARGIEPQTLKLFEVCRRQHMPIFTFINKIDRPALHPLEMMDQIERTLGMKTYPMNWPIGDGNEFRGVYDRMTRTVHLFERTEHGSKQAPVRVSSLDDPLLDIRIGAERAAQLREEMELLEMAGTPFDLAEVLSGRLTPVCFGSAMTNFGVQLFLDLFLTYAPAPKEHATSERVMEPTDPVFSGFVFKIQANMDPRHRDRVAYLRIVSGKFERDMEAWHPRLKRKVRLSRPMRLFGQDREVVDEAFAGDVVGLINPGTFTIGDTISSENVGEFAALPRFQPEFFSMIRHARADRYKQFLKGLVQIEEEGAIQLFYPTASGSREPILGAVGALQFDVVKFRLEAEYNVETIMETLGYSAARWVGGDEAEITTIGNARGRMRAEDKMGRPVILFTTEWDLRYAEEHAENVTFQSLAEM